jgi:hypothetical protein
MVSAETEDNAGSTSAVSPSISAIPNRINITYA